MTKLSDMSVRTLQPANYRFPPSNIIQAVQVEEFMLEDNLLDFTRFKLPKYRPVIEDDLLQLNDVVIALSGGRGKALLNPIDREVTSVGIYHPGTAFPEPVTLAPYTLAFRALNLSEAVSILACLIYRLDRRRDLALSEVRVMPVTFLTDEQVTKFLTLIKTVHEIHDRARKREKLLKELIPATIHKFFNDDSALT